MDYSLTFPSEAALSEIDILFDKLFENFPYSKIDFMIGLMMLEGISNT
jgi:hypothetical protein